MRRYILLFALPLFLAACGGPTPPAADKPAATKPAAEKPAQPAATPKPATEAAASPLFGNWAADPANCGSPIVISATRFEGAENLCDITALDDNGDGTFTAAMSCQSEGKTAEERVSMAPLFGPQGEGIRFSYVDRGGEPVTVFRCD